jgi:RND family efflux transporter MFP subunit
MSDSANITLDNVSRFYGEVLGVNRVTLSIPPGITSLVGPNGSGKTTLMNLMTGLVRPTYGQIRVLGVAPSEPQKLFRLVGYSTQFDSFPKGLTGFQFIQSFLRFFGYSSGTSMVLASKAIAQAGLNDAAHRKIASYSKGMRQRIKLAQAIAHDPKVLVLDEPLNGLDPMVRAETIALFRRWANEGRHVIVSSHVLHEVDLISDRVILLTGGYVVAEGQKGAMLAKIDDSVYAADISVAKAGELTAVATLDQMNAKLDQAGAEWKRAQELYLNKLMAQVDYDTDKANYEVAKANVSVAKSGIAQAQADLDKAQRNVDFCIIKSPVAGVIIDRRVNIGQTVVSSLNAPSLFLIAEDLTKMQIWVAVNEADVARIKPGTPVTFTCDAFPGRQFEGTVGKVRLNATMTQNVVMYTVVVNTENPDKVLLPYLTANVDFTVSKQTNALLVPNAALRWSPSSASEIAAGARSQNPVDPPGENSSGVRSAGGNQGVVWLKDGEFVRPVEVKVGTSDGSSTAVVADNLKEGEEVVTGETMGPVQGTTQNPFVPRFVRH